MSSAATTGGPYEPRGPRGTIRSVDFSKRGAEVTLRLRNDDSRPVHYISSVRTIRFDPATKRVVVGLSDEGRVVIPGAADVHPNFSYIDPGSEAELQLVLPPRIVKLAEGPLPDDEVRFEQHDLADADEIVVEVAWSDIPYYEDVRAQERALERNRPGAELWMKGKTVMAAPMPGRESGGGGAR
ncbi:MAG TPA: hypothetical protein VMG08_19165 [Allosphingosinicella sp.]|nr:hypothetical protein [Allosphingosinicella sp.]